MSEPVSAPELVGVIVTPGYAVFFDGRHRVGDEVVDVPIERARHWVASGWASYVDPPNEPSTSTRRRRVRRT